MHYYEKVCIGKCMHFDSILVKMIIKADLGLKIKCRSERYKNGKYFYKISDVIGNDIERINKLLNFRFNMKDIVINFDRK